MADSEQGCFGYLKFFGPSVDEGRINPTKAGKSLIALERFFKAYMEEIHGSKAKKGIDKLEMKVAGIRKNCTEIQILFEQIIQNSNAVTTTIDLLKPVAGSGTAYILANTFGLTEFCKQFFGTLGQQLALKVFSKGAQLRENKKEIKEQKVLVHVFNVDNEEKIVGLDEWENYQKLSPYTKGLVQLDKNEKLKVGYEEGLKKNDTATIEHKEKAFFEPDTEDMDSRMNEPFDESKAKDIKIVGRFVDFYGLAHKYHFSFQARRSQDDIGKQKILCIIDPGRISEVIEYLKPEKSINLCISGKATRDNFNKVDKIKIEWFSEDENFNPDQTSIE